MFPIVVCVSGSHVQRRNLSPQPPFRVARAAPAMAVAGKRAAAFTEVSVGQCLAVRGGCSPGWSAVPTSTVKGREVFEVNTKATWLILHAFGVRSNPNAAERAALMAFCDSLRKGLTQPGAGSERPPAAEPSVAPARGLRKLGVGLSDPPSQPESPPPARPRPKAGPGRATRRAVACGFFSVTIEDTSLSVLKKSGPGVWVEAHPDAIAAVVRGLRRAKDDGVEKSRCKRVRPADPEDGTDEDGGRLRWCFSREGFIVRYQAADGKMVTSARGLRPSRSCGGLRLSDEAFLEERGIYLIRARMAWNTLDQSAEPRFEISAEDEIAAGVATGLEA